ncbi:mitochondrial phosphate carrier protein [Linnemannia gamsii]|uniref:Mitochondrial phosphate carrier protein n=1 Tax=Linnemannia gamsii TaxID=64522 RepID=A0ABQ7KFM5_9FUNG|nr:mitochondrial phosphate carrier protein [Linnemannia gamsii]
MSSIQTQAAVAPTGASLYARYALAGAIGCGVTHGALTPVDVVKTRIQLEPTVYNKGMGAAFRQVVKAEGGGVLLTGFGPTFAGYFLQGAFKFGGYEFWRKTCIDSLGSETAQNNRLLIYSVSAGIAEFFADVVLCPLEATRIRLVSQPTFATGLVSGFSRILKEDGVIRGFYSGFGPILLKQIPYTMTKFVVYERVFEAALDVAGPKEKLSGSTMTALNLGSGLVAGIAAAIVSQPADTLLSKINKSSGTGTITSRLVGLASELGVRGLFLGLGPRIVMVGTLTAFQFALYGDIKAALGATGGAEIAKKKKE